MSLVPIEHDISSLLREYDNEEAKHDVRGIQEKQQSIAAAVAAPRRSLRREDPLFASDEGENLAMEKEFIQMFPNEEQEVAGGGLADLSMIAEQKNMEAKEPASIRPPTIMPAAAKNYSVDYQQNGMEPLLFIDDILHRSLEPTFDEISVISQRKGRTW